jgi:two-component system, LuxR family, response regulator FixJ
MNNEPLITIIDDDEAYRDSLVLLIGSFGYRAASYPSAEEFLRAWDHQIPGCLIIDVRMPETNGLALQRQLSVRSLAPSIIIMSGNAEIPDVVRAMHQGAVDFLLKTSTDAEFLDAIHRALKRDQANRDDHARRVSIQQRFLLLSPCEMEVLYLVLKGMANKNIAAKLQVSPRTVEDRRARIMNKLQVESVPALVSVAICAGIQIDA